MKQNLPSDKKKNTKRTPKDKQISSDKPKKLPGKGKRTRICDIYNDVEDQYMCMERAALLLERLDLELPMFAKCMLPSNVVYSFWLILPTKFCVMHLPEHDATITLVDESGKEYKTNFLKARHGLSAGWRGFSLAQKLIQGDILFFLLVEPCKLQVNIVRRYGSEAIEAATCLMEMHPRVKKTRTSSCFDKTGKPKKEKFKLKEEAKRVEGDLKNQLLLLGQTRKGKRTHRGRKRVAASLSLHFGYTQGNVEEDGVTVPCVDNNTEGLNSEKPQASTSMTNESEPNEVGPLALNLGSINCHSTARPRRIFHSSTVAA